MKLPHCSQQTVRKDGTLQRKEILKTVKNKTTEIKGVWVVVSNGMVYGTNGSVARNSDADFGWLNRYGYKTYTGARNLLRIMQLKNPKMHANAEVLKDFLDYTKSERFCERPSRRT